MASKLDITTDRKEKEFSCPSLVPLGIIKDRFMWLDGEKPEDKRFNYGFFRYRRHWYHVAEFTRNGYPFPTNNDSYWHCVLWESATTGVCLRISNDGTGYIAGSFRLTLDF